MMWGEPNTMKALGEALTWCIVIGFFAILFMSIVNGVTVIIDIAAARRLERGDITTLIMFVLAILIAVLLVFSFWSDIIFWFRSRSWVFYAFLAAGLLILVGLIIPSKGEK